MKDINIIKAISLPFEKFKSHCIDSDRFKDDEFRGNHRGMVFIY